LKAQEGAQDASSIFQDWHSDWTPRSQLIISFLISYGSANTVCSFQECQANWPEDSQFAFYFSSSSPHWRKNSVEKFDEGDILVREASLTDKGKKQEKG